MDDPALSLSASGNPTGYFTGERFSVGSDAKEGTGRSRRRPTLRESDRLTDALRVARAVLRRVAAGGGGAADIEAVRSAIEAADAALGETA